MPLAIEHVQLRAPTDRLSVELWTRIFQLVHDAAPAEKKCSHFLPLTLVSKTWKVRYHPIIAPRERSFKLSSQSFATPFLYQVLSFSFGSDRRGGASLKTIQTFAAFSQQHVGLIESPLRWTYLFRVQKSHKTLTEIQHVEVLSCTASMLILMPQLRSFSCDVAMWPMHLLWLPKMSLIASIDILTGPQVTLASTLRLLASATNLTELCLSLHEEATVGALGVSSCTFPLLEHLRLCANIGPELTDSFLLMQRCHFPQLTKFSLDARVEFDDVTPELKEQFSRFMKQQTGLQSFDFEMDEGESMNDLLDSSELILPKTITLRHWAWPSTMPFLMARGIQTLIVEGIDQGFDDREFLDELREHSALREVRLTDFVWRDGDDRHRAEVVGRLIHYAIKLEPYGVKVLDRDGVTFRNAAPF